LGTKSLGGTQVDVHATDQGIRPDTSLEKLAGLKLAFKEESSPA